MLRRTGSQRRGQRAAYVAANRLSGTTDMIEWQDLVEQRDRYTVVDVRTASEWAAATSPALCIFRTCSCASDWRNCPRTKNWWSTARWPTGYVMERVLKQHGFHVKNLSGGWTTYEAATEPQSNL